MSSRQPLVLSKSDATSFFAALARDARLIAPKRHFGGDVMFGEVGSPEEIVWEYGHDLYPPTKRFIYTHFQDLFRYRTGEKVAIEDLAEAPKQIMVGVRSCDVKAVRFQERFFGSPIVDPYYMNRAANTVIFSLVCNAPPRKECFCICCDAGPYLYNGFDVQLTDLGDKFLYEIGSDKGAAATEPGQNLLKEATPDDMAERKRIELRADSLFETVSYIAKAINYISSDEVPEEVWEELGSTCFRCGACTNLCPICTCYTIEDRAEGDGCYVRRRWWDSCQFLGFTREASGFNPRATQGRRVYRRFYHKASYQYITRDTTHGCVGCGRCLAGCLTHLGFADVVKRIRRSMHKYLQKV